MVHQLFIFLFVFCLLSRVLVGADPEPWGIVLVDLRSKQAPTIFHRMIRVLKRLAVTSPNRGIELWISPHMVMPAEFQSYFKVLKNLETRQLNVSVEEQGLPSRTKYGYISKAYALLETKFKTAFFFDSDVWFCDNWEAAVNSALEANKNSKVLWTIEKDPYADFWFRNSSSFTSPELAPNIEDYKKYPERNTGSVFGIRKSPESNSFLRRSIRLWHDHRALILGSDGYMHPVSNTDQGAFREGSFLLRESIQQAILDDEVFCRGPNIAKNRGEDYFYGSDSNHCNCNRCSLVHYANFFDKCTQNITITFPY